MSSSRFSATQTQRLRKLAAKARAVPAIFENGNLEGWFLSPRDPMDLLDVFPTLHLKSGFVLKAVQYVSCDNGNGAILALTDNTTFPDSAKDSNQLHPTSEEEIKKAIAVDSLMDVIDGDRSPFSYLSASLFAREAGEFGAIWHGCWWTDQKILFKNPVTKEETEFWSWQSDPPEDWRPSVTVLSNQISVVFYTFNPVGLERIIRYEDVYPPDGYTFKNHHTIIAEGSGGIVY